MQVFLEHPPKVVSGEFANRLACLEEDVYHPHGSCQEIVAVSPRRRGNLLTPALVPAATLEER